MIKVEKALVCNNAAISQDMEPVFIWEKRFVFNTSYDLTARCAKVTPRTPR